MRFLFSADAETTGRLSSFSSLFFFFRVQARLFNTEDTGYDVLVASDAIGMGLNLNIRR